MNDKGTGPGTVNWVCLSYHNSKHLAEKPPLLSAIKSVN